MTKACVEAKLKGNMGFEMNLDGHILITDANEDIGGDNLGPRPKQLLMSSLIGCTGIDIMAILNKMKVEIDDLSVRAEAKLSDGSPQVYESIHLIFTFYGKDLPMKNLEKAVKLSQEKYCGVTLMLEKAMPISYEIIVKEL